MTLNPDRVVAPMTVTLKDLGPFSVILKVSVKNKNAFVPTLVPPPQRRLYGPLEGPRAMVENPWNRLLYRFNTFLIQKL